MNLKFGFFKANGIVTFFILATIIIALTGGCSNSKEKKIGLLLHREEGRWTRDLEYLQKHCDEMGVELVVKIANGDENVQLVQAEELIDEKVSAIIAVVENQNTAGGIVRSAHKAGIKVIAYDRIIANCDLDYLITFDYIDVGRQFGEYVHSRVPKGNYVIFWGDASDANAMYMKTGQMGYLEPYIANSDINVIYKCFAEGWSGVNAAFKLEKILAFSENKVDVIIANNDDIAQGVIKTYEAHNLPFPKVITGQDATLESCRLIMAGKQTMTIYKSTTMMAREAIELAVLASEDKDSKKVNGYLNNKRKDVPTILLQPVVVDKSNLVQTVVADGVFTESELY